jgi:hypothetical protein
MQRKLQDYIHFYIGQPCVNSRFGDKHDMYDNGWILAGVDKMSAKPYKLENSDDFTWSKEVLVILRPLSDMTDEEMLEYSKIGHKWESGSPASNITTDWAYRVCWLVQKGFDVFNLIKSGIAIDKTKGKEGKV